jgi:hypothetical protein
MDKMYKMSKMPFHFFLSLPFYFLFSFPIYLTFSFHFLSSFPFLFISLFLLFPFPFIFLAFYFIFPFQFTSRFLSIFSLPFPFSFLPYPLSSPTEAAQAHKHHGIHRCSTCRPVLLLSSSNPAISLQLPCASAAVPTSTSPDLRRGEPANSSVPPEPAASSSARQPL